MDDDLKRRVREFARENKDSLQDIQFRYTPIIAVGGLEGWEWQCVIKVDGFVARANMSSSPEEAFDEALEMVEDASDGP